MVSETNKIAEETTVLSGSGFPVDPVLRILWRGIRGGACCYDDDGTTICDDTLSQSECIALDGNFIRNAKCIDDPCATGRACCINDGDSHDCQELTLTECIDTGGYFPYDDPDPIFTCDDDVCCTFGFGLPEESQGLTFDINFTMSTSEGCLPPEDTNAELLFDGAGGWYAWRTFEGVDWTIDDVGDYCGLNTYTNLNTGLSNPVYIEVSGIQYGTIGSNTGWFVIIYANLKEAQGCESSFNTYTWDYELIYLGATFTGSVYRTVGPYLVGWVFNLI